MNTITRSVLDALYAAPCSVRTLARAAGVSHANLFNARRGEREVSVSVALALAGALERLAKTAKAYQGAARAIRRAVRDAK